MYIEVEGGKYEEKKEYTFEELIVTGQFVFWTNKLEACIYMQLQPFIWGKDFGKKLYSCKFCDIKKVCPHNIGVFKIARPI